ncbi:MAG: FtsX-like permease family protein [Cellulosilyticum sp.]|nr:FtsX-like permease family protein [Cellulosilyticum sp.]
MREIIKSALAQLAGNKLRTFLTMLGMLIGVGSVIMILSLGEGMKGYVSGEFEGIGQGTIQVMAMVQKEETLLTDEDVEMLEEIPQVVEVFKHHSNYMGMGKDYNQKDKMLMLYGFPYDIEKVSDMNLKFGRWITEQDEEVKSHVVVVEDNFSKIMFKESDPQYALGKSIEILIGGERQSFEIVGIVKSQYPSSAPADMIPPIVYLPFTTLDQYIMDGEGKTYSLYVLIDEEYDASEYSKPIRRILNKKHGDEDVYMVSSLMEATDTINDILDKLSLFTSVVAAVSLLVGGIGIMNIMMVTVRERTREIGVRKALGATDQQILVQFLVEAIILTVLGGLSGLLVGYLGGFFIASALTIEATLTPGMIIFSIGTSSIVGIIFGVYPAYKAAKLDPVEALREE